MAGRSSPSPAHRQAPPRRGHSPTTAPKTSLPMLDPATIERDLAFAIAAARDAGDRGLALRALDRWEGKTLGDVCDQACDGLLHGLLAGRYPDDGVLSEETVDTPERLSKSRVWIVDPLDGTKEFIHRRGDFTVNIALVEQGVPTRGVVYAPAKERMFFTLADGSAVEETGAFDPQVIGATSPIRVAKSDNAALMVVASKSHRDQATEDYIGKYAVKDSKSAGSSLKFCLVATGEADIYPRVGRTMEWDTAAGHAVLCGAGGKVVGFDDHAPLMYGKEGYANPFFIATAPDVDLKEA